MGRKAVHGNEPNQDWIDAQVYGINLLKKSVFIGDTFGRALSTICETLETEPKEIENVIFNGGCTIIKWTDGDKTIVKCDNKDEYDKVKGFLFCYLKGLVGNKKILGYLDRWVYGRKDKK